MSNRASKKTVIQKRMDIFPSTFSEEVYPLDNEPNFQSLSSSFKLFPCIIYVNDTSLPSTSSHDSPAKVSKVYFDEVPCNAKLQTYFVNCSNKLLDSTPNEKMLHWSYIHKRLLNANTKHFKNTNQRTCFIVERNHFLVPQGFTFGVRTVAEGTAHLFLTHNIPLEFYQLQSFYKRRLHATTRLFEPVHQNAFYHKKLKPHTHYWIPSGTTYVVTSLETAYFAVHLVRDDLKTGVPCENPLLEKKISMPHGVRPLTMETPNVSDERFERYEPSDPVLLAFDSGQEVRVSSLCSDPPPPVVTFEIKQFPLERTVQVVAPEVVSWYAATFAYREYDNPRQVYPLGEGSGEQEEEPMDLSVSGNTGSDSFQDIDTIVSTKRLSEAEYRDVLNSLTTMDAESGWRDQPPPETVYIDCFDGV